MNRPVTRRLAALALAAVALTGTVALTGCSSSGGSSASPSGVMSPVQAPVVLDPTATSATMKVGQDLDINVTKLAGTTIEVDSPDVLEISQGHEDGGAQFNPGAKAIKAGTATITVTNADNTKREIVVTVTE